MKSRQPILAILFVASAYAQQVRGRVIHEISSEIVDMSRDGKFWLLHGSRTKKCEENKYGCREAFLTVYSTEAGKQVGELVDGATAVPFARFKDPPLVELLTGRTTQATLRQVWDPTSGSVREAPFAGPDFFQPLCPLGDFGYLGRIGDGTTRTPNYSAVSPGAQRRLPVDPGESWIRSTPCHFATLTAAWLNRNGQTLSWINVADGKATACASFPDELVNYTISPDDSLIVAVTRTKPDTKLLVDTTEVTDPTQEMYAHLLQASDCSVLRKFKLEFPEKPTKTAPLLAPRNLYWKNAMLRGSNVLTVSPDNSMMAIGYGVRTNGIYSDAPAYFAIYSISHGRRLARMKADTYRNGLLTALRYMDCVSTTAAPVTSVRFSPDSRTLYAGSLRIWAWDVSGIPR